MRKPLLAVLGLAVLGLGFALGRMSAGDGRSESRQSPIAPKLAKRAEADAARSPDAKRQRAHSIGDAPSCDAALARAEERVARWEAKAKLQGWILGNAQESLGEYEMGEDDPMPWDDATPEKLRKAAFERALSAAAAQADAEIEFLGASCEEAPCIAMLRLGEDREKDDAWLTKLQQTPAWSESYDNLISSWGKEVECPDGRKESVALLSKPWDDMPDEQKLHATKRWNARCEAILKNWICRGGR